MYTIKERIIKYKGKAVIVSFSVDRCTHVAECLRGAPQVFDTKQRPWIRPDADPPDKVAEVIMRCPTGALHFERTDGGPSESVPETNEIILVQDGPVYMRGDIEIVSHEGDIILRDTRIAFCRCGFSQLKPLCDNTHIYSNYIDSGAISDKTKKVKNLADKTGPLQIKVQPNGPLMLKGPFVIKDARGDIGFRANRAALCRCGSSKAKPFCDGTHSQIGFST
jgi:CDGSH-type Zn-finger protein/uncharacterized Fe-S cluster protein YjdI